VARFEELVAEAVAERRSPAAAHAAASPDAVDAADTEGEARSA